jgi:hypothetical protein
MSLGGLTDEPIVVGEIVRVNVFGAPDFTLTARVSAAADSPYPILGSLHILGLDSAAAAENLSKLLKDQKQLLDSKSRSLWKRRILALRFLGRFAVRVFIRLLASINFLIFWQLLADEQPIPHNSEIFDSPIHSGDRVLVRACGDCLCWR